MRVKALVTAAGMGRRFGALTRKTNKSLLRIQGQPLLKTILERLYKQGIGPITVVTGYQSKQIDHCIKGIAKSVYNPFYSVSGILGSFWAARNVLSGHPFVFTTSDHYFHPAILRACTRKTGQICVVVQKKKVYTKEDAKVIIRGSRVVQMSKKLPVNEAHGEFGGMAYFGAQASRLFFKELQAHFENNGLDGYMMDLVMSISHKYKIPVTYSLCEENSRIEIDSVHDLVAARKMALKFKKKGY